MPATGRLVDYLAAWVLLAACVTVTIVCVRRMRQRPSRRRLLAGNALVFVTLLVAAGVAAETYLRYVFDGTTWHANTLVTRAWFKRHERYNERGWRDIEFRMEKLPREARVAILGDSFTYGYGIADPADRFGDRVRAALSALHPGRYDVWVVGKIGANTAVETGILADMLDIGSVDRVVLAYAPNDVEDLLPATVQDRGASDLPADGSLGDRSFLLNFLVAWASQAASDRPERYFAALDAFHRDTASWERQAVRLREMAALCRAANARLDVAVFPLLSHWGPDYPFDAWHDRIETTFREAGVAVVDLRAAFRGHAGDELRVSALDAHPNERAHALAADAILAGLFPR